MVPCSLCLFDRKRKMLLTGGVGSDVLGCQSPLSPHHTQLLLPFLLCRERESVCERDMQRVCVCVCVCVVYERETVQYYLGQPPLSLHLTQLRVPLLLCQGSGPPQFRTASREKEKKRERQRKGEVERKRDREKDGKRRRENENARESV